MIVLRIAATDTNEMVVMEVLLATGARQIELERGDVLGLYPYLMDDGLVGRVTALLADRGVHAPVGVEPAELLDWDTVWRPTVRPFRAGPLTVAAFGEPGDLVLDVGAFGTGHHPTTRLCIDRLVERVPDQAVLDVGTGSGVLALVALALGAPRAVGTDIDPLARRVAEQNAARNGLADRFVTAEVLPDATFGLVLANVSPSWLRDSADVLSRRVGSGGELVVSGFTAGHVGETAAAFVHHGLRVIGTATRDGWARLDLAVPW